MKRLLIIGLVLWSFALLGSYTEAAVNVHTHLGQPASNSVTLEVLSVSGSICLSGPSLSFLDLAFQRNLPDGSSVYPFVIPSGDVLVVTDMDWQWNSGTPGTRQTLRLFLVNTTTPIVSNRVFESTVELNSFGGGGTSEAATAGFVVSPAATICVSPDPVGGVLNHLILRGYLAPIRPARGRDDDR